MRRAKKLLIVVLALALAATLLVACNNTDAPSVTQYTLKYSGGEGYTGTVPADAKAEAGSKVTLASALQWEGYDFVAWTLDGNEYAAGAEFTMPEKDVTLVAKWEPKSDDPTKYTLSYAGGEIYKGTLPAAQQYAEGATVTLADALIESGYTFLKWTYGSSEYDAKATFTMPAENVTMTAKWSKDEQSETPPTAQELDAKFYTASNWVYMTNNNGASNDGGDIPYSLSDGSIKFHRLNQAVEIGNRDNGTFSFMLKATNDFHFWMNSTGKDNQGSNSYRLSYEYSGLRIEVDGGVAATVSASTYQKAEWNRFDVVFKTDGNKTTIALWVNGEKATLALGDAPGVALDEAGNVVHTRPARFETGGWAVVKVWEANNYVQFKPVSKADEKDVPIVAAVGASITEGAGAGNFYTESYPAQLQKALGGAYNVVNLGKSGRTVRTDTGVESDNTPVPWLENVQFDGFKALKPDIVIINMGTNDSKTSLNPVSTLDSFKAAYEHLIDELLKVNPEMRVIACTVPTAYSDIYDINNDNIQNIIAPAIKAVAEEKELELVDLCEITKNKSLLFTDGVHPGTEGYAMFVEVLEKVVKGEELTKEFLDGINEKYNDPTYEIEGIHGEITVENGEINLTVTGNIQIDEKYQDFFKLDLYTGDDAQMRRSVPFTTDDNGDFSVKARLDDLTGTSWYNVRVYYSEFANYLLTLDDVEHTAGTVFRNNERKVTVQTWTSGDKKVFSLQIADLDESDKISTEIQSVAITTTDGVKLTVSGTTTAAKLTFYAGVDPKQEGAWRTNEEVTLTEGAFSHTFDLEKLFDGADIVSNYINFRLYYEDGSYVVVPLDKTTIDGTKAAKGNSFTGTDKKFTIQSWSDGGIDTLSIVVSEYDDSYNIVVSEVKFEDGKVVISGTYTGNVNTIVAYLYETKEASEDYNATATLNDGSFVASVDLEQLKAAAGNWYFVQLSVNGGARQGVTVVPVKPSDFYLYKFRSYKWENANSTNLAVNYSDFNTSITKAEIKEEDGKPMLTIEGLTKDATLEASTLKLILSKTSGSKEFTVDNTATEAGQFAFAFDLSKLDPTTAFETSGLHYFLRLYINDTKYDDINSRWAADKLFDPVEIGNSEYCFSRNNPSNYYTLGVMRKDKSSDLVVTYTEIKFEEGKFVVSGTAGKDVETLVFTLHNDNDKSNTLTASADLTDASFTVSFTLSECTLGQYKWYYLYVNVNNMGEQNVPSSAVDKETAQNHTYGGRVYRWQIAYENLAIDYEDAPTPPVEPTYSVTLTSAKIEVKDGKIELTITGTTTDKEIRLYVGNVVETQEFYHAITLEEGAFNTTFDLATLATSKDWYNVRIYMSDGQYYAVSYEETKNGADETLKTDDAFIAGNRKVTIKSWDDNGVNTLSLAVEEYDDSYTIAATSIAFEEQYLVVTGTATGNVQSLVLALHNDKDMTDDIRETATVTENAFTVKIDLTKITLGANSWLYLWYSVNGGADAKVQYEKNDTKHVYGNREYRFENWEGIAIAYSDYTPPVPEDVKIQLTEMAFEGANLKVKGAVTGATALKFSLYASEDSEKYEADATITEGAFEATIALPPSATAHNGSWYRLQVAADDEAAANMTWDKAQNADTLKALTHNYGNFNYKFADNNDIAIITGDYSPALPEEVNVTLSEIKFDGANLIVKGTVTGTTVLKMELHAGEDVAKYAASVTLQGEEFEATIALPPTADAHKGSWYRLRVKTVEDESVGYTNLTWDGNAAEIKAEAKAQTHVNDAYSYKFEDTGDIAVTYADYVAPPVEDKSVTVSSMRFADGKFIVEGKVGTSITKIIFHLHNTTNPAFDLPKQATLEGQNFKVEFPLGEIKREDGSDAPATYINVRYEINEEGFGTPLNLLPANNGGYAVGQEYRYSDRTWTLKADNSRTYLNWSKHTESYTITKCEITDKEGVATLTIEGTYTGDVDYSNLQLKLDKTSDTKDSKLVDNTATEAGQFKFEVAINELLTSTKTENSKE